ncbi:FAD binding domain-containing protein [Lasiosphaeria hispida]|uniref:FAD binding domain-containing protein n=1 Tax=Lasiosphaeria hispida TaxID=260671 RepID=A0AAJ0M866_9PEZI|nr:FAD binding domain-containing protein [Lasiosphaeria hispida]
MTLSETHKATMEGAIETEFLVVGAGPAGASLACFLTMHGRKGIMISASSSTATTPRAHITNPGALECLRDLGLEEEIIRQANKGECLSHMRWCHSMAGEEFARVYAFGAGPGNMGDFESVSPCKHLDLPQTLMEPILVRHATTNGFAARFQTTLLSFTEPEPEEADGKIVALVRDELTKHEYRIRTKYLFGADGARSVVVKQLGLPLSAGPGGGTMINVLVRADLSHLMKHRQGNLHWVMQPERETVAEFGVACIVRMVKPWHEWLFIMAASPSFDPRVKVSDEAYTQRIREFIGDDTPVEVLHTSPWQVNEKFAERYSKGNVFCLGDAVHRHPPHAGLGSNTCIQDAYNLAWKIAYVSKGLAAPSLLDTYNSERQPVGRGIVTRANDAFRDNAPLWEALGMAPPGSGPTVMAELKSSGPEGRARRVKLREAVARVQREVNGLGYEMNQQYVSAGAYTADEEAPFAYHGKAALDPVLYHQPSTYPGRRVPHVWLNKAVPEKPVSTIDLTGHGAFTLLTGHGGALWKEAAQMVGDMLGVNIKTYSIGFRQDWEDVYLQWEELRGVEESGTVLVRPDRVVAWRAQDLPPDGSAVGCRDRLAKVMKSVLGLDTMQPVKPVVITNGTELVI